MDARKMIQRVLEGERPEAVVVTEAGPFRQEQRASSTSSVAYTMADYADKAAKALEASPSRALIERAHEALTDAVYAAREAAPFAPSPKRTAAYQTMQAAVREADSVFPEVYKMRGSADPEFISQVASLVARVTRSVAAKVREVAKLVA